MSLLANLLKEECSQFIIEAKGHLLFKQLPIVEDNRTVKKVKIRHKRQQQDIMPTIDVVFEEYISTRSLVATTTRNKKLEERHEWNVVIPINGYKFIYANEANVIDSNTFMSIQEQLADYTAEDIFQNMIKSNYKNTNLFEAFSYNSQVILYNIPYYYAISEQYWDFLNE